MKLEVKFSNNQLMQFQLNMESDVVKEFIYLVSRVRADGRCALDYTSYFMWTKENYPFDQQMASLNNSVAYFNENNGYGDSLEPVTELSQAVLNRLHLAFEHAANRYVPEELLSSDKNQTIEKLPARCPDIEKLAWHLNNVNGMIHALESALWLSDDYVNSYFSTFLRNMNGDTESVPLKDHQYSEFTLNAKFGDLLLGYGTTGKNLFHIYQNKDLDFLCAGNHPSPQRAITTNILAWFSEDKEHDFEWNKFDRWAEENRIDRFGFDWRSPKSSIGYIKLGELIVPKSLSEKSKFDIIRNYSGIDPVDYYVTI